MRPDEVLAAGSEDRKLIREMAVESVPLDTGAFRDRAHRRMGRPQRPVKRDRRLDDPLASLGLGFGALPQCVSPLFHRTTLCIEVLDSLGTLVLP